MNSKNIEADASDKRVRESIPGWKTQFPNLEPDAPRRQFVIGLDFGTAYTKVVIGETTKAYAVPFLGHAEQGNPYLLPGILTLNEDGCAHLGAMKDGTTHSELKMRLLDGDTGDETIFLIATFLTLVLQNAREWFFNNLKGEYQQFQCDWCINVGLPTHQYHDEQLKSFYRDVIKAAWLASLKKDPVTIDCIEDCFADSTGSLSDEAIGLFPEFVAQVNSYVKSPLRQPDLHLLVDVGAGTVDVAVFVVHETEQGDMFPIQAKSVSKRGVNFLPADPEKQKQFAVNLRRQFKSDIDFVKKYKYPEYWDLDRANVLPFFLCGGGSYVGFYRELAEGMVEKSFPCELRRMELPTPQRLVASKLPPEESHRLSVAYGLSFDTFDIGQIVPEQEEPRDAKRIGQPGFTTCPNCNGSGGARGNDCRKCGGQGWLAE